MRQIAGKPSWTEVWEDDHGNRFLWRTIRDLAGDGFAVIRQWRAKSESEGLVLTDFYETDDPLFQGKKALIEVWSKI